jgi:nucleoside-diphosphate-sugar epimerase
MSTRHDILITGANGFLGSEIAVAFHQAGHRVTAMVRRGSNCERLQGLCPNVRYANADADWANVPDLVAEFKPHLIIHVAAAMDGGDDVVAAENLITTNVLKPTRLLAAAKAASVRGFITVGTAWQHFDQADFSPVNLYAASKQAFDDVLRYYAEMGLPCASLHMFDTYGPNDPRPKLVNLLFKLARNGENLAMSPGEQEIDLIHTHDAARAFMMAADQILSGAMTGHQTFAVSGGQSMPLKSLAALAEEVTGKKINIQWGGREYRAREVMQTWRTGKPVPGWVPEISVRQGLTDIWQST